MENLLFVLLHHYLAASGFLPVSPFWYNIFEWCMDIMMIIFVIDCIIGLVITIKCVYEFTKD